MTMRGRLSTIAVGSPTRRRSPRRSGSGRVRGEGEVEEVKKPAVSKVPQRGRSWRRSRTRARRVTVVFSRTNGSTVCCRLTKCALVLKQATNPGTKNTETYISITQSLAPVGVFISLAQLRQTGPAEPLWFHTEIGKGRGLRTTARRNTVMQTPEVLARKGGQTEFKPLKVFWKTYGLL